MADNTAERDLYESLAEIYSIIVTLDALERAYLRDSIQESEYTETCDRLLRQYKSNLADDTVANAFGDLESFKMEWDVSQLIDRLSTCAYEDGSSRHQKLQNGCASAYQRQSKTHLPVLIAIPIQRLTLRPTTWRPLILSQRQKTSSPCSML